MNFKYYNLFFLYFLLSIIVSCSKTEDYVPVVDVLPIATNDAISYGFLETFEISILTNDTTGDEVEINSVSLIGGADTDNNGTLDQLTIVSEGIWSVNTIGVLKFIPVSTFLGIPSAIKYTVKDKQGNVSNQATITVVASQIVSVNLVNVPYPRLSDYKFFSGDLKNQTPSANVLPYEPASSLFTDYAHKKRFVWMPAGQKATYNGDTKVLELPVGAALIKTFYYDKMQPSNTTRIIETRVMIRKTTGWIFADYIWNAAQTEATFSLAGSFTNITFKDDNNIVRTTDYRIPNDVQCIVCHKANQTVGGVLVSVTNIPIGIKPQNLNFNYDYNGQSKNQLAKWIEQGYLQDNFTFPTTDNSTVNYNDTSKSLSVRARSYIDANCSHCHQTNRHCDYRPMRFAFNETSPTNPSSEANFGLCVNTADMQSFPTSLDKIIKGGNPLESMLYYRINTTDEGYRMPLHGRTLIHDEGVNLIRDWINTLSSCH